MPLSTVTIDRGEALQGCLLFTPKIALDRNTLTLDHLGDLHQLILKQLTGAQVPINPGLLEDPEGTGGANPIDVAKRGFDSLLVGYFNSKNSCFVVFIGWLKCY